MQIPPQPHLSFSEPLAHSHYLETYGDLGRSDEFALAAILWRRKGLILFFLLCGLGAGWGYFTWRPQLFQAGATVEVFRQQTRTRTDSAVENVVDLAPSVGFIQAEMTSDDVLRSAIELGQLTSFETSPPDSLAMMRYIREDIELVPAVDGAEALDRSLVQVLFEAEDPLFATAVVNGVVQAYEEYVNGRHRRAIENVAGVFRKGRGVILPKLEELEQKYAEFRGDAPLEWSPDGSAVNPFREDALRLEESVHVLELEMRQVASKLKLIEEASNGESAAVAVLREVQFLIDEVSDTREMKQALESATDAELVVQEKMVDLRIQADLLQSQFAPNHPQRRAVEQQLAVTEKTLRELEATRAARQDTTGTSQERQEAAAKSVLRGYVSGLRKKRQLMEDDIHDLNTRLEEVRGKAHQLIAYENENETYLRQIQRYQDMLDAYDSQLDRANLPTLNLGLEVRVHRPAGEGQLVAPLLARSLLVGAVAGMVLGGCLGWLLDWSERTFRNPDEVAAALGVPILSHLPWMVVRRQRARKGDESRPHADIDPIVRVLHDPHAAGSEAIRAVRTALLSELREAEYRVVQITSSLPGDGKSTVVANLAASIAGASKRVVVVDADLRRPTQCRMFGINANIGITNVLNGDCETEDAIVPTEVEGLYVLPAGPMPSNPAEALALPEFGEMIDDLRTQFDLVLVDTPPMLSVTDASNVASQVDGVMFVMRIGRNSRPMAKRATTILHSLHVNIVGLVVNAIGDSGYSAAYANSWSNLYGGQPGAEYGFAYYRYGSDRYLNASRGQTITVRGRRKREG